MIDKKHLGKMMKKFRTEKDITLEKLAEQSDITAVHLSNLESGRHIPQIETLVNILNALGINFATLIDDSDNDAVVTDALFQHIKNLKDDDIETLTYILSNLKKE